MNAPFGLAGIDSAGALVDATARALKGQGFPALGRPKPLQYLVSASDMIPVRLRRRIYAAATGFEAISHAKADKVDLEAIAAWATEQYEAPSFPAVIIGSSSGALSHLAALIGAPILPQTFMIALLRKGGGIDDPAGDLEQARAPAQRLLDANPGVVLHQMHDPSQDRLSLRHITYFRTKFRRLPKAYVDFLTQRLAPGGTIIIANCKRRWPTTRVSDRHVFQFGAEGGMEPDEYHEGSARVRDYLHYYNVGIDKWSAPKPDSESPEAEWGFEQALEPEILALARKQGVRVVRVSFAEPDDPSATVAEFYRSLILKRGRTPSALVGSSFILIEPWMALHSDIVPYWKTFNSGPSFSKLRAYLERAEPYEAIKLMIFPHGTESVGLPAIEDWEKALSMGRNQGEFLGVNRRAYPHHFSGFARYHSDMRRSAGISGAPLNSTWQAFESFAGGPERSAMNPITFHILNDVA